MEQYISYFSSVYNQFYNKIYEVDYFLNLLVDNYKIYRTSISPRDIKQFHIIQYIFSAFLSATETCWEIAKVTQDLAEMKDSSQNHKVSETKLENEEYFKNYFATNDTNLYNLFQFLKKARNASCHDGTISFNGGENDKLYFYTDIIRYEKRNGSYIFVSYPSPKEDVITIMFNMALKLIPLFEAKLIAPPKLTDNELLQQATSMITSIQATSFKNILNSIGQNQIIQATKKALKDINLLDNHKLEAEKLYLNWQQLYNSIYEGNLI